MLEINILDVKKNFGFKNIFESFNLDVLSGDRIGIIGPNGSGKTTLFKLIMKQEIPDLGTISIRKEAKIGFLSQNPFEDNDKITVKELLMSPFEDIINIAKEMEKLEMEMAYLTGNDLEKILKKYGNLQQKYIDMNGYQINSKISDICNKFKIDGNLLTRHLFELSGGEKTIVSLASIVISKPDILLLDEPTNNLDIETLEWLEMFLKNYSGTIIMSSHDRYFLDKVATKIALIEGGKCEIFHGNYSYFLKENERRILSEFEQYKDQQKMIEAMKRKIKQLQEFGRLAGQSGGEPFFKRATSIQKRLDKIELLEKPEVQKEIPLNFKMNNRSGNQVLLVKKFNLNIGNLNLLNDANFDIYFKDRICLMGKNGCGKSTLIKYIINLYNSRTVDEQIKIGSNVLIGYIPQNIVFKDNNKTILEVCRQYYNGTETGLRASLAKFMFNGENVFKRVGTLSGGEKVRLKLFELIQQNINFLIMDEPTNHIDITTREVLENSLKEFQGTIFFISHDRYFINELAEKILYIENQKITEYLGNYNNYKEQKLKSNSLTKIRK